MRSGRMQWKVEGQAYDCGPGDVIVTPAGVAHSYKVLGDEDAKVICVDAPVQAQAGVVKIVGLGGSRPRVAEPGRAPPSRSRELERPARDTELLDLRELDLPMYNPDIADPTEAAEHLLESSYSADGMIWSSPMYQGTISGAFKNALDWLHLIGDREPPYLHDKVIGLISAAGGTQGLQAINTMEFSVRALRGWAVPYVVPIASAARVFDAPARSRIPRSSSS